MKRPKRLLVDADGVLFQFTPAVIKALHTVNNSRALNQRFYIPTFEEVNKWDFFKEILGKRARDVGYKILLDPSFWRDIPVMAGARLAVDKIRNAGIDLVCVTSPWEECSGWESARRWSLLKNFGFRSEDVIIATRKEVCVGEAMVDDKTDNIDSWKEHHKKGLAVLYRAPYNKGTFDWDQVDSLINKLS